MLHFGFIFVKIMITFIIIRLFFLIPRVFTH